VIGASAAPFRMTTGVTGLPAEASVWASRVVIGVETGLVQEERRALRRAVAARRAEFAAGRRCAKCALADLGRTTDAIPVGAARAPVWPPGVVGSITHTAAWAIAAVAPATVCQAVGIDLQGTHTVEPDLAAMLVADQEMDIVNGVDDGLTVALAAKEALGKGLFTLTQMRMKLQDLQIVWQSDEASSLVIQVDSIKAGWNAAVSIARWRGHVLASVALDI
jgi:enterobactin synthetase component D / holo-[acyl-carrier protein] synthase